MLKNRLWGSNAAAPDRRAASGRPENDGEALELLKSFEQSQAGWFWSTDEVGRLTYLTDSVSSLLAQDGPQLGRRFRVRRSGGRSEAR